MAYTTMLRTLNAKEQKKEELGEAALNGWLKEGTDQGWTLHSFTHDTHGAGGSSLAWYTLIWETND